VVRLKIYLVPDEHTLQFCRYVNAAIRRLTDSAIVFGTDAAMIPHITLATGDLAAPTTLEDLAVATQRLAGHVQPLTLRLGRPYLEPVHAGYVLCDVQHQRDVQTLSKLVRQTTRGACPLMREARSSLGTHLTLAHIEACYEEVHTYLQSVQPPTQVLCSRIEIARCGAHGTCTDRLFGCDLASGQTHTTDGADQQPYRVDALCGEGIFLS
jgi:hypothetical protein